MRGKDCRRYLIDTIPLDIMGRNGTITYRNIGKKEVRALLTQIGFESFIKDINKIKAISLDLDIDILSNSSNSDLIVKDYQFILVRSEGKRFKYYDVCIETNRKEPYIFDRYFI